MLKHGMMHLLSGSVLVVALCACGGGNTPAPAAPAAPTAAPAVSEPAVEPAAKEFEVVKAWDFTTLPKEDRQWFFPGGTPMQNETGIWYATHDRQSGPEMRGASFDAAGVNAVRVSVYATPFDRGLNPQRHPITKVELYFAREGDVTPGEWPYSEDRRVDFQRDAEDDTLWLADPTTHWEWNGEITRLMVRYTLGPKAANDDTGFSVFTRSIEMLR